jgi:hypothetical protein
MTHEHDWLAPSPFWSSNGYQQAEFYRPALFELRSDDFMDEFLAAAAAPHAARLESQRLAPAPEGNPSKLFQPAHGRFYLAAASLCCREPGFPDRQVRRVAGERTAFVLRKLVGGKEYAWIPAGADTTELPKTLEELAQGEPSAKLPPGWQPLDGSARDLLKGEERLPLFPVPLADGRQLFCGYVPVSSSQTYNVQPSQLAVVGQDEPRVQELSSRFITPLYHVPNPADPGGPLKSPVDLLPNANDVAWTTSVYLLLELWEYLDTHLPAVATAVKTGATPDEAEFSGDQAAPQAALLTFLRNQKYKGSLSLAEALQAVATKATALNAAGGGDLAALGFTSIAYNLKCSSDLDNNALNALRSAVKAALPAEGVPVAVPKLDISSQVHYVLRFVYERTQCQPAQVEVSLPSQPFVFAPFFDADAPARPVRIPLPSDVSIAGLRKAGKNVSFMMSDAMRKKMAMLLGKEETFLSDNPETNPAGGLDFAFICSFSIQIIFIVAFMLLLIFVVVFNIIFWWLAFFKICLPVPKALLPD